MVMVDNVGFSTGSFGWQEFEVVSGQKPTFLTGSDGSGKEFIPVLFLDFEGSWNSYGVNPIRGGDCPDHPGGWCHTELLFNPLQQYFFLLCPLDAKIYRYLNNLGQPDDFKVVSVTRHSELDENMDWPWYVPY